MIYVEISEELENDAEEMGISNELNFIADQFQTDRIEYDYPDEAGLENVLLYVGGNIVVGKQNWEDVHERFKAMGFDRIYKPGTSVETTIRDLKEDLGE